MRLIPSKNNIFKAVVCFALVLYAIISGNNAFATNTKPKPNIIKESGFSLSSPAFNSGECIPLKYASVMVDGGGNISIPFSWEKAPKNTGSFVLLMTDKSANDFIHWFVINIPSGIDMLLEGGSPMNLPSGCDEVRNGFGTFGYIGPEPPQGSGIHEYEITLYALKIPDIDVNKGPSIDSLKAIIESNLLAKSSLTGKFVR